MTRRGPPLGAPGWRPRRPRRGAAGRASAGSHHARSRSSTSTAGMIVMRTTKASKKTATANAKPMDLMNASAPRMKPPNTPIMMSAAEVTTGAPWVKPTMTARTASSAVDVLLAHACDQEHLVVHGEAEHDPDHEHRQQTHDGRGLLHPEQCRPNQPHWNTATTAPNVARRSAGSPGSRSAARAATGTRASAAGTRARRPPAGRAAAHRRACARCR